MPPTLIRQATAAITTVSTVSKTSSSDQLDIDIQKASSAVQPRPTGWRYRLGVLLDEPRSSTAASGVFTLVIEIFPAIQHSGSPDENLISGHPVGLLNV